MSGVLPEASSTEKAAPFVTISYNPQGQETIATNLPPQQRPLILWMLRRAEQIVLTQASEQEKSNGLVKPNGMAGLLKRMGKA